MTEKAFDRIAAGLTEARAHAKGYADGRREALEEAAEEANGIAPEILEGKSEYHVGVYCRARVDAASAIRALLEKEGGSDAARDPIP